jgi:hypothetical protein
MLAAINMPEALRITLKYRGPSVDDGTMPIEDVVEALEGFAGAYGKLATRIDPEGEHQLRIAAVKAGSFELVILAWIAVMHTASTNLESLKPVTDSAKWIFGVLKNVIRAKKHVRSKPYDVSVSGDNNTVVLFNADRAQLAVPPQVLEILRSKLIDSDLNKIAAPVGRERIDAADLSANDGEEAVSITTEERESFSSESAGISQIDTEIVGIFVSLNKERNNGSFKLGNGRNVRYRYVGDSPEKMHVDFAHKGPVRIRGTATLDENLEVSYLDIKSIERLQRDLPMQSPSAAQ